MFKKLQQYPFKAYPIMQQPSLTPNKWQSEQIARKFGMFLHFGINTFNNTEWSDGNLPVASYAPSAIDADNWVRTAYESGMNFVVLVTKHHDGFCLWDTDTTEYSVKMSSNKTDVVAEVAKACEKYGIKLGLYYSLWDRHETCYKDDEQYVAYMETQLTELLDGRYGEVIELWFDGGWEKPCRAWQLDKIYSLIKTLQPKCQMGVNLTIGKYSDRKKITKKRYLPINCKENDPIQMFPSDFRLWDPFMCKENDPKIFTFRNKQYYLPFEMTICSRKSGNWFYRDDYDTKPLMDVEDIEKNYRIIEKSNNIMVINLPPDKDGRLVNSDVENLLNLAERLNIKRKL